MNRKLFVAVVWFALIVGALYFRFTHASLPEAEARNLASASLPWAYTFYFAIGCVRGFTFMPLTILLAFGMLFLAPVPLFLLTMGGTLISSAGMYSLASVFNVSEGFQRKHKARVEALQSGMKKYELPIIVGWSLCPIFPTDVVCCVSGVMKSSLPKLLVGILIGEGICCAIYIFFGSQLYGYLGFRP